MKLNATPLCFIITYMTGKKGKKGKSIFSDNTSKFCNISLREKEKKPRFLSSVFSTVFMDVLC